MKIVLKYPLMQVGSQFVQMPIGAELLCVAEQAGQICLWARIDQTQPLGCRRYIEMAETGNACPEGKYIGSVFQFGGSWHFFDGGER